MKRIAGMDKKLSGCMHICNPFDAYREEISMENGSMKKKKAVGTGRLVLYIVTAAIVFLTGAFYRAEVQAAEVSTCTTYTGDNIEDQNYTTYASPIKSYLVYLEDGTYMRVQAGSNLEGYLVEYYDEDFTITRRKMISTELDIFGGFYQMGDYYYILSGQKNAEESDDVEVYRLTKYTKDWSRVASCGLYGANTYIPFDAGSARMASYGNYLMIRTCHEMYETSDGYHHQANVTIQIDTSAMKVVDSFSDVMNTSYGYVSHSFNQFIQMENGKIVAVDHGDAYPRSAVLIKYPSAVTSTGFTKAGCQAVDVVSFTGEIGANYTGASIGGFEISDTAYLVAGSMDIDSSARYTAGRNIFIGVVSKDTGDVSVNTITDYTSGNGTTDTPQFVKIGADSYMLLWHRGDTVYYTKIDGDGKLVGTVYSLKGDLSDCVPILAGNKLVWYTWGNGNIHFYQIRLDNPAVSSRKEIEFGHEYTAGAVDSTDMTVSFTCRKCGDTKKKYVIQSFSTYWYGSADNGYYYSSYDSRYDAGTALKFMLSNIKISDATDEIKQNQDMTWETSDNSILSVSNLNSSGGTLHMLEPGIATLSIYPTYHSDCKKSYTFRVGAEGEIDINTCSVSLSEQTYSYTGAAKTPAVTVTYKGMELENGTDYTVAYANNTNAGTATVTVKGIGIFGGNKNVSYTITGTDDKTEPGTEDKTEPGTDDKKPVTVKKTAISKLENVSSGVSITWKKVSDASGYIVYRKTSGSSKWVKIKTLKGTGKTHYTDKAVKSKNGKTYAYQVVTYKDAKGYARVTSVSKQKSITRLVAPTKLKVSNVKGKKIQVRWKKQSKITGYQIQYSTSKTFAKGNKVVKVSKSAAKKTIAKLKKGKTYYVRIRTYTKNKTGTSYSAWSGKKTVKIKK